MFDFVDEILIEVSLVNVVSCYIVFKSVVGERFSICVNEKVVVDSLFGVMFGEDGFELSNFVGVGFLNIVVKCCINVGQIRSVIVFLGDNVGVDVCGIVVLQFEVDVGDGIVGIDINYLVIQNERYFWFIICNIRMNEFIFDVYDKCQFFL